MAKFSALLTFFLMFGQTPVVNSEELSMFLWSKELAPIISIDTDNFKYKGIVLDVLDSLPKEHQVKVKIKRHNRIRGEAELYSGEIDFTILPKEWLKYPDKLIFSLPIYVLEDFLYATKAISNLPFAEILKDQVVCTRRNYVYPKLTSLFVNDIIYRMDSNEGSSQFGMLMRGRCDFVVINDFVGQQVIQDKHLQNSIIKSKFPIDSIDFTFAFHPSRADFLVTLNQHITQLKNSGALQKIIERHRKIH